MQQTFNEVTVPDLTVALGGVRAGQRYLMAVTGASSGSIVEFQHSVGGAWFAQPNLDTSPVAGVISFEFVAIAPRMRFKLAPGHTGDCTVTCVKLTVENF